MIKNLKQNVIFNFNKTGIISSLLKQEDLPVIIITENSDIANDIEKKLAKQNFKSINLVKDITFAEKIFVKRNLPKQNFDAAICDNFSFKLFADSAKSIIFYDNYFSLNDYYDNLRYLKLNFDNTINILIDPIENLRYYSILNSIVDIKVIMRIYNLLYDYQKVALGSKSDKEIYVNIELFNFLAKNNISEKLFIKTISILENYNYIVTNIKSEKITTRILGNDINLVEYIQNEKIKNLFSYILTKNKDSENVELYFTEIQDDLLLKKYEIIEQLEKLEEWGFIELQKKEKLKLIKLLDTRIDPRYLQIDLTDEEKKSKSIINQFKILNEYLFTNQCRNSFIANLSESKTTIKCMKCDNCTRIFNAKKMFSFLICSEIIEKMYLSRNSITQKEILSTISDDYLVKKFMYENNNIDLKNILKEEIINNLEYLFTQNVLLNFEDKIYLIKREKEKILSSKQSSGNDKENSGDITLFHKLNSIRKIAAKKYTQTEELICSDKILIEITNKCPTSPSELFKIDGFTQRMFNKIGEDILKIMKEYKFNKVTDKNIPTELKQILDLIIEGHNLKQISKTMNLSETFISFQIEVLLRYKPDIDISNLISAEDFEKIKNEYEKGKTELNSIYETLENRMNKNKIRIALAKILFS